MPPVTAVFSTKVPPLVARSTPVLLTADSVRVIAPPLTSAAMTPLLSTVAVPPVNNCRPIVPLWPRIRLPALMVSWVASPSMSTRLPTPLLPNTTAPVPDNVLLPRNTRMPLLSRLKFPPFANELPKIEKNCPPLLTVSPAFKVRLATLAPTLTVTTEAIPLNPPSMKTLSVELGTRPLLQKAVLFQLLMPPNQVTSAARTGNVAASMTRIEANASRWTLLARGMTLS